MSEISAEDLKCCEKTVCVCCGKEITTEREKMFSRCFNCEIASKLEEYKTCQTCKALLRTYPQRVVGYCRAHIPEDKKEKVDKLNLKLGLVKVCKFCSTPLISVEEGRFTVCRECLSKIKDDQEYRCTRCGSKINTVMGKIMNRCAKHYFDKGKRHKYDKNYTAQEVIDAMEREATE